MNNTPKLLAMSLGLVASTMLPAFAADNPYGYVSGGSSTSAYPPATSSMAAPTTYNYPPATTSASSGAYGTGSYAAPVANSPYASTSSYGTGSYGTGAYGTSSGSTSPYSSSSYPATTSSASSYGTSPYAAPSSYGAGSSYGSYTTSAYPDTLRAGVTTIPQGTILMTRLDSPINSYTARTGDPISGSVEADIYNGTQLVVPAGSSVLGSVTDVTPAGRVGKQGSIALQFNVIRRPDGSTLPFQGHLVTQDNTGVLKAGTNQSRIISTAVPAVGGAAAGGILGLATGGLLGVAGTGLGTGLAIGTVAGVSYALIHKGPQVNLPSGSRVSVMVDQPVAVN